MITAISASSYTVLLSSASVVVSLNLHLSFLTYECVMCAWGHICSRSSEDFGESVLSFHCGFWDLNSGLHACMASTLSTKPSLQVLTKFLGRTGEDMPLCCGTREGYLELSMSRPRSRSRSVAPLGNTGGMVMLQM